MQVEVKKSDYQSFGGINFLNDYLIKLGFGSLVEHCLGSRRNTAQYSYSDLLKEIFFICSIGGDALDDSNTLRQEVSRHPGLKVASSDTIEYAFQELKQPTWVERTETTVHYINEHNGFNQLLPLICKKSGMLSPDHGYTMDYDGHIVENTKNDNAFTYKKMKGYYPTLCSINKLPVYMQNRKGNTPEGYKAKSAIEEAIQGCLKNDITIKHFRADACCYQKDVMEYLESLPTPVHYFIRAEINNGLRIALEDETEWKGTMLNYQRIQVCSITETVLGKPRRIVAYRKRATGQLRIDEQDGYSYHAIATNDTQMSEDEVLKFYNQRGCQGEHHFKELDHDFNWNKLPFDTIEMNTIYMYATLVAYQLFNASKQFLSRRLSFVNVEMRLKNFILHFVTLPARWIKSGRRQILKIFTTRDYRPLWNT